MTVIITEKTALEVKALVALFQKSNRASDKSNLAMSKHSLSIIGLVQSSVLKVIDASPEGAYLGRDKAKKTLTNALNTLVFEPAGIQAKTNLYKIIAAVIRAYVVAPSDKNPLDEYVSQADTTPELLKELKALTDKEVIGAAQFAKEWVAKFRKAYPNDDCVALVFDAVEAFDKKEALKIAA
tara:strand:+ start:472 stop:1017 length:546 start_codon:yes stop_codon:yes gene_type:complete